MTKVRLDLISDVEMYLFFETTIRAAISCISKRSSKVKNKYLTSYISKNPTKYITQMDKNNLYGYAISISLLIGVYLSGWMLENLT